MNQMMKIENAIILAAGRSSRFVPYSLEYPKGLITVKGETMVERQIKQLHKVGIRDITVVTGYKAELYDFLKGLYQVDIVFNPEYGVKNNTSSMMLVADRIKNTYICASDHFFSKNIFEPYSDRSYYTAKMIYERTTDYSYQLNEQGCFSGFKLWSENELGLVGPCCFLENDAAIYIKYLREQYQKESTSQKLWEEVLGECLDIIQMYPRVFEDGVIYEFDDVEELRVFDKESANQLQSEIIENICGVLHCKSDDIYEIEQMKAGLTNTSFSFCVKGKGKYVYRHPGDGTDAILSRKCEAFAEEEAKKLGLDNTFIYMDANTGGWKISSFIKDCDYIDPYSEEDQRVAMKMLKKLHDASISHEWEFHFIKSADACIKLLKENGGNFDDYLSTHEEMGHLCSAMEERGYKKVLCHNDTWFWNFIKDKDGNVNLIDWEYAGMTFPGSDVADYVISLDFDNEQYLKLAEIYEGHSLDEEEVHYYEGCLALIAWYWFVWALYQESTGTQVEDKDKWYEKAVSALAIAGKAYIK